MSAILDRVAGAPITWGVCEVPGWGVQLDADRVLGEMAATGLRATELGPEGFLPPEPQEVLEILDRHGLALVAGFVAAVLHLKERREDELRSIRRSADLLAACGAQVLVLAAAATRNGYESGGRLEEPAWDALTDAIEQAVDLGAERGLRVAVHPHHGTAIEGPSDIEELLGRSAVGLCLDTGHAMVGGADPRALVRTHAGRIGHVHLKDVDRAVAERVRSGDLGYQQAVRQGLYRPLGTGDAGIAEIVGALEASGYRGWYVIEQDTVLADRLDGPGCLRDAAASVDFVRRMASELEAGKDSRQPEEGGRSHEASPKSREEVGR